MALRKTSSLGDMNLPSSSPRIITIQVFTQIVLNRIFRPQTVTKSNEGLGIGRICCTNLSNEENQR